MHKDTGSGKLPHDPHADPCTRECSKLFMEALHQSLVETKAEEGTTKGKSKKNSEISEKDLENKKGKEGPTGEERKEEIQIKIADSAGGQGTSEKSPAPTKGNEGAPSSSAEGDRRMDKRRCVFLCL